MKFKIVALVLITQIIFLQTSIAQQRGVGVKVKKDDGKVEEVQLYKESHALIIGVSDYTNGWKSLPGVKSDVKAVSSSLKENGFIVRELVNPTRSQLSAGIDAFINDYGYETGNRLLIYFAGHGHTQKAADGRDLGYIVPTDAPLPNSNELLFRRTALSMNEIDNYARRIEAKHALFIFDSCFSGSLLTKRRSNVPPIITLKTTQPVRQFITAGADDQEVPDVSIFRQQFVEGLKGDADLNNDGYITGSELADFLQEKVGNYTRLSQTPQYGKIFDPLLDKGDFVFVVSKRNFTNQNNEALNETSIVAKSRTTQELEAWNLVKNSNVEQDFRDFLTEFPEGVNSSKAKIKLEQIVWEMVKSTGDADKIKNYLDEFPKGANASSGRILYSQLTRQKNDTVKSTPNNSPQANSRIRLSSKLEAQTAAQGIKAAKLQKNVYFIADDSMQGRDTPSPGLDATANFIASRLSELGVKPAGDTGSYFQRMWVVRKSADPAASSMVLNGQTLKYGDDFFGAADEGTVNAPIVFGGTGWMHKAKGIDTLAGVDVKGKIVVLYGGNSPNGLPAGLTFADLQQGKQGEDWATPVQNAAMKGAVAIINLASPRTQANWARASQGTGGGVQIENLRDNPAGGQTLPVVTLNQNVAKALFEGETANPLTNADAKAFAFSGNKSANITIKGKTTRIPTQNVIGKIEGSDPVLKNEHVVLSAHYDHVGVNPNAQGDDKIFNGADDNASGTSSVLSIAEAFASSNLHSKRSVLFIWHTGEEKGLLGSEYFTKFSTVPIDKIIAHLNVEMIGRSRKSNNIDSRDKELSGENEIYVIGSNLMSSELRNIVEAVNKSFLNLIFNYNYDDPSNPNRFFYRGDQVNYANKRIPSVLYFGGIHSDYHQVTDTPDKIDYAKMERVTRTIFMTLWELANTNNRPQIDKKLPLELTRQ